MSKSTLSIFVLIFLFNIQNIDAQENTFNIGFTAGLNFAKIGTYVPQPLDRGTEKFYQELHHGLNAGIIATMQMTEYSQLSIEFLFSQNGKYVNSKPIFENQEVDIFINYLELPIHYNWQSNISRRTDFNNFHFEAGVAYARLLTNSSRFLRNKERIDPEFFDKTETLLLQTGMTLMMTRKFGLNLKASLPADIDWTGLTFATRLVFLFR